MWDEGENGRLWWASAGASGRGGWGSPNETAGWGVGAAWQVAEAEEVVVEPPSVSTSEL